MYSILNTPMITRGIRQPTYYLYVKRALKGNVDKVISYCRTAANSVESSHLLVKILNDLNASPDLPLFEYYEKVSNRAMAVAKANKISSSLWKGNVLENGEFYGKGTSEIILAVNEGVDILNIENDWESIEAVRILRHGKTSLSLEPLIGHESLEEYGLSIIQIDVVKLAMQYRQWYKRQADEDVEFFQTPMQFVYQYPLANALGSHLDVAIVNRLQKLYKGASGSPMESTWPFYIKDVSPNVDKYLMNRIAMMARKSFTFENLLEQVELIFSKNIHGAIRLPQTAVTRQISWIFNLVRMPIISLVLQIDNDRGGEMNTKDRSILRKKVRVLEQDKSLTNGIPRASGKLFINELRREISDRL